MFAGIVLEEEKHKSSYLERYFEKILCQLYNASQCLRGYNIK